MNTDFRKVQPLANDFVTLYESPETQNIYANIVIDDDDLHVLSRSGDKRAKNPHAGNRVY